MSRRRLKPDGLPFYVYERYGKRSYSIFFKGSDNVRKHNHACPVDDKDAIAALRRKVTHMVLEMQSGKPAEGSFKALAEAWWEWQNALPLKSPMRRAQSTLDENRRELDNLIAAFGHMPVGDVEKADGYAYLDACLVAKDEHGNPRPRPAKGNKEIALGRAVFEYGIRIRMLKLNPFDGVEKLITETDARYVTEVELAIAVATGRRMGGPYLIVALALLTAYLCVRRSVEVRALTVAQITSEGIVWAAAKRKRGTSQKHGLIKWSPMLKETIDEAMAVKRHADAGEWYVFGNLKGERYTKGGWKKMLSNLMAECVKVAAAEKAPFQPFSLQDCRPAGVTDKIEQGHEDVQDATMHTSMRMILQTYDRRTLKVATPTR